MSDLRRLLAEQIRTADTDEERRALRRALLDVTEHDERQRREGVTARLAEIRRARGRR